MRETEFPRLLAVATEGAHMQYALPKDRHVHVVATLLDAGFTFHNYRECDGISFGYLYPKFPGHEYPRIDSHLLPVADVMRQSIEFIHGENPHVAAYQTRMRYIVEDELGIAVETGEQWSGKRSVAGKKSARRSPPNPAGGKRRWEQD